MAISRPRTARHSSSPSPAKFRASMSFCELGVSALCVSVFLESHQISPPTRAPRGNNPIRANESIVFPLPDSPTKPRVSPAAICRDSSFTGLTHPTAVGSSTVKDRISSKAVIPLSYGFETSRSQQKPPTFQKALQMFHPAQLSKRDPLAQ